MSHTHRLWLGPGEGGEQRRKHGVAFEEAMAVFLDPLPRTIPDPSHDPGEEECVTLGEASSGNLLVVVHTWEDIDPTAAWLASSRRAGRPGTRRGYAARSHEAKQKAMRDEYDLHKAECGKFHRPDAVLVSPMHLNPEVLAFFTTRAEARGMSELVNTLLKKDIELIEGAE